MEIILCGVAIIIVFWCIGIDERKQFKAYKIIGNKGENIVSIKLKALDENFIVENDVHLGNCQIDHMVINHALNLIYVIETKFWSGIITGDTNEKYWIQDKNGVLKKLYNPILQNRNHCKVVREYYPDYKVYNVVVFVGNKKVPDSRCIFNENDLVPYINRTSNQVSNRGRIEV